MKPDELKKVFRGVGVIMTTPFKDNRELDKEGVRKHARFLVDHGIKTGTGVLIPTGSTGECPMLRDDEIRDIIEIILDEVKGEVPVVVTCNHTDTRVVIEQAKYAQEIGADGVMICPHYYWKPSEGMLLTHYKAIAKEIDLGIVIDNASFATGVDMSIESIERLVDNIPNIIALKENSSDIGKWDEECMLFHDRINIVAGNADCHWPYVALIGSVGMISGIANFAPERMIEIYEAVEKGDYLKARELHRKLMPVSLFNSRVASEKYKSFLKEIMNLMGIPAGPTRLPLVPLSDQEKSQVKKVVQDLGFI